MADELSRVDQHKKQKAKSKSNTNTDLTALRRIQWEHHMLQGAEAVSRLGLLRSGPLIEQDAAVERKVEAQIFTQI